MFDNFETWSDLTTTTFDDGFVFGEEYPSCIDDRVEPCNDEGR